MKKQVMKRAWEIYRQLQGGDRIARLSVAMKQAWREVKAEALIPLSKKLTCAGYSVWAKGDHKRIYINNFWDYLTLDVSDDDLLFNGISLWEKADSKRDYRLWREWILGHRKENFSLYYDCKDEKWVEGDYGFVHSLIASEVIKAIENGEIVPVRPKKSSINISKDDPDYYSINGSHELGMFKAGMPRLAWIK